MSKAADPVVDADSASGGEPEEEVPREPEEWELRNIARFDADWAISQEQEFEVAWQKDWLAKQFLPAPHSKVIRVPAEAIECTLVKRQGGRFSIVKMKELGASVEPRWILTYTRSKTAPSSDPRNQKVILKQADFDLARLAFSLALSSHTKMTATDEALGDTCTISIVKPSLRRLTVCIPQTSETARKLERYHFLFAIACLVVVVIYVRSRGQGPSPRPPPDLGTRGAGLPPLTLFSDGLPGGKASKIPPRSISGFLRVFYRTPEGPRLPQSGKAGAGREAGRPPEASRHPLPASCTYKTEPQSFRRFLFHSENARSGRLPQAAKGGRFDPLSRCPAGLLAARRSREEFRGDKSPLRTAVYQG
ncbi:unnamed protein product [Amoebophrya sp. A25]|nr:unnamed protein product [Amoebophrya sp. A25]|eukprot:GSA25T00010001001.1